MKISKYFAMAAIVAGLALPTFNTAEAANVALLPLINNVVEREDLGAIYYDRAVEATKNAVDYDIVESSELDKAVETYIKGNALPDKAACEKIAAEGNVDVIFIMQADKLGHSERGMSSKADVTNLYFHGKLIAYNALTGQFTAKNIRETKMWNTAAMARYDIIGGFFGDSVTREMKRVLGVKKISVERPKIGNIKGNKK